MAHSGLYVKLDTNFPDDDKIEAVGLAGAGLFAAALCIAKRTMTDGRLTRSKLYKLGATDELIDSMVEEGLFSVRSDEPGHVLIAAWLGHNDSTAEIEQKRAEEARRKRLARAKRPAGHQPDSDGTPTGQPDTEEKRREEKRTTPRADAYLDDFTEAWAMYPKKIERKAALRAYQARRRSGVSREDLLSATKHYSDSVKGARYIKNGATFYGADDPWADWVSGPPKSANGKAGDLFAAPSL